MHSLCAAAFVALLQQQQAPDAHGWCVLPCLCCYQVKTVLDHSGYRFPVNPLHPLFPNNAAYHDTHHDLRGFRKNYSQPFFTHWDWLLGTYMDPRELREQDAAAAKAKQKAKAS